MFSFCHERSLLRVHHHPPPPNNITSQHHKMSQENNKMSPVDPTSPPAPRDFKGEIITPADNMDNPERDPGFFTTPGTQVVSALLLVKRYTSGIGDNVHIMRINKKPSPSRFRFPSLFIPRRPWTRYNV